jgi:hypothetical protein
LSHDFQAVVTGARHSASFVRPLVIGRHSELIEMCRARIVLRTGRREV